MASNKLKEILEEIRSDKNQNLTPDNLKKGVTVLGISGTYEGNEELIEEIIKKISDLDTGSGV